MSGHPDEVIVARALENGWVQEVGDRWTGWRYRTEGGSTGYPVGIFQGPKWEWDPNTGRNVKICDGPYEVTWADAMRSRLDHDDRCGECGRWIEYGFSSQHKFEPFCFGCTLWMERIAMLTDGQVRGYRAGPPTTQPPFIAIDGGRPAFHTIGTARTPSSHNGFGGSWYVITFLDGREIETCDLWFGGPVPERFQDRLPVTAELRYGRLVRP